ncbi:hypothetical protein [Sodalis-like endosymbiont of Proechinophthirus fluctus]|uniref:hypothetical protein n=1 Tax=Sodalis-like endosymbiont of Proechinophthirus fluctus TaxID=1462730 RepID=UPI000A78A735|nr:hypothetical protein [Sodalis-like endosymbiont of Proechinophthirus fluctus]
MLAARIAVLVAILSPIVRKHTASGPINVRLSVCVNAFGECSIFRQKTIAWVNLALIDLVVRSNATWFK